MNSAGYDLDGVLCEAPPKPAKAWGKMNGQERRERKEFLLRWYESASPLLLPSEDFFHIITARKEEAREVTEAWVKTHLGVRKIKTHHFSGSRNYDNVSKFKAAIILKYDINVFTEDSEQIIRRIRKIIPLNLTLRLYQNGVITNYA